MHQHPSTGEGEIDPHPRAPTNPENPRPSLFVEQCPKRERESESERRKDSDAQTEREREIVPSNPFLRSRTQKSSNPFDTDCHEPRNRQTHSPPIIANLEIVAPFVKPEIFPPNRRSACSL